MVGIPSWKPLSSKDLRRVVAFKHIDSGQVDFNDYTKVRQGSDK